MDKMHRMPAVVRVINLTPAAGDALVRDLARWVLGQPGPLHPHLGRAKVGGATSRTHSF